MRDRVITAALALAAAAGAACRAPGSAPPGAGAAASLEDARSSRVPALPAPGFLHLVPASTAFIYAALEPPPIGHIEREYLAGLAAYEPVRRALDQRSAVRQRDILTRLPPLTRAKLALLGELGGAASRDKLTAIGLAPQARFAIHGEGSHVVIRIELSDPDRFRAALARMTPHLAPAEPGEHGGVSYLKVRGGEDSLLIAVAGDHLVLARLPEVPEAKLLSAVLGTRRPERSLVEARLLDRVAAELGALPAGLGYVDLTLLAGLQGGALPAPCAAELSDLTQLVPRMSFGLRHASGHRVELVSAVEARRDLADTLLGLRGRVPGADPDLAVSSTLLISLAIDAERALGLVKSALDSVKARPYRCPALDWLNRLAREARALLPSVAATPLAHIRGASVLVLPADTGPGGVSRAMGGLVLLAAEDPPALLRDLAALMNVTVPAIQPGRPPTEIPFAGPLLSPVHAAASGRALGISLGGRAAELAELIAAPPPTDPPLLVFRGQPAELRQLVGDSAPPPDPAIAAIDADLAGALAAAASRPLDRYEEVSVTARASSRGLELRFSGHYPR
jgi:hypothetical protein